MTMEEILEHLKQVKNELFAEVIKKYPNWDEPTVNKGVAVNLLNDAIHDIETIMVLGVK